MSDTEREPALDRSALEQLEERLVQRVLTKISAADPQAGEGSSDAPKKGGEYGLF